MSNAFAADLLDGRTALVIGGGSGLGLAIAEELRHQCGLVVLLVDDPFEEVGSLDRLGARRLGGILGDQMGLYDA